MSLTLDAQTAAGAIYYTTPPWRRPMQAERRDAIARFVAGAAAEAIFLGLDTSDLGECERALPGSAADFIAARAEAGGTGSHAQWRLNEAWAQAVRTISRRWASVEAIAGALLERGTLDGTDVAQALAAGGEARRAER